MYPRISNHVICRPCRSPERQKSFRSISSGIKQFTLPSLTPCKSPIFSQKSPNRQRSINESTLSQRYEKFLKEKQKYSSIVQNLRFKIQKVESIKETYGIEIPRNVQLTPNNLKKLETSAKMKFRTQILSAAVGRIETWWKKRIIQKKIEKFNRVLENSAKTIQKYWKQFIAKKELLNREKIRNLAAVKIQKCIRGYLVRKKIMLKIKELRMAKVFEYFTKEKMKIMQESAKKILMFWRICKNKWVMKQERLKRKKKTLKGKRRKVEEPVSNSFAAFPEPEPSKVPEGVERPKKILTVKTGNNKKNTTPASPLFQPARMRSNTEPNLGLEVIKEVKNS